MPKRASVFFSDRTEEQLERLGGSDSRSQRIAEVVDRYSFLIGRAKQRLAQSISVDEISKIRKALQGLRTEGLSAVEAIEELENRVTAQLLKAGAPQDLLTKISTMDELTKLAIVDWLGTTN